MQKREIKIFRKTPIYQANRSIQNESFARYRRRLLVAVPSLTVVVIALGAGAFIWFQLNHQNDHASGKGFTQAVAEPKWQTFRSSFFQFRDYDAWVVDGTPTNNKVTYAIEPGGNVAQSFTVYMNQTLDPSNLAVTRALPVKIMNGDSLNEAGAISGTCSSLYKPGEPLNIGNVSISGTTILCRPGSSIYSVLVGEVGGSYILPLKRSNGQTDNYLIQYTNSSMNPDPTPFLRAMQTFKAI